MWKSQTLSMVFITCLHCLGEDRHHCEQPTKNLSYFWPDAAHLHTAFSFGLAANSPPRQHLNHNKLTLCLSHERHLPRTSWRSENLGVSSGDFISLVQGQSGEPGSHTGIKHCRRQCFDHPESQGKYGMEYAVWFSSGVKFQKTPVAWTLGMESPFYWMTYHVMCLSQAFGGDTPAVITVSWTTRSVS